MADEDPPRNRDVHDALNEAATDPDPTEWPDPYDKRKDPRGPDEEHPPTGATSTSEPPPPQDEEAEYYEAPERDKLDE